MKIQKWMMPLGVLLVFFICTAEECATQSDESPAEALMQLSIDLDYESCKENIQSAKDIKQCDAARSIARKPLNQDFEEILALVGRGPIDDDDPCPIFICPDNLKNILVEDLERTLSKVVLRKKHQITVRNLQGKLVAEIRPSNTPSKTYKNHYTSELKVIQPIKAPALVTIKDTQSQNQYPINVNSDL